MFANKTIKLFLLSCMLSSNTIEGSLTSIRGKITVPHSRLLEEENPDEGMPGGLRQGPTSTSDDTSTSVDVSSPSNDSSSSDDIRGRSVITGPSRRQCRTNQSQNQVEFECKAESESSGTEIEDEIKFKVGATRGDFLKITIEHESEIEIETNSRDTDTEVETKFTVVYDRLIEYRKVGTAADNHFEWEIDEIVNEYTLDNWDNLTPLQTEGDLLKFSASMGIATFSFTIAQTESLDLTTNKMKIDFLLENYPWAETGDTFIALVSHIETEMTTEIDQDGESDVVREVLVDFRETSDVSGFVPFGEYNWASTAEAGNFDSPNPIVTNGNETDAPSTATTSIAVVASTSPRSQSMTEGRTFNEIAFAFTGAGQGADRIYWDPEAGIGYGSNSSSAVSKMASFASIVAAAVSMALLL